MLLLNCAGCTATKFVVDDFTYDETWNSSLKIIQDHHIIQTSKKSSLGICTFKRKIDKKSGEINVAKTYPPFGQRITKLRIFSQSEMKHIVTIKSIQHSIFYVGPSRDQDYEESLKELILEDLQPE